MLLQQKQADPHSDDAYGPWYRYIYYPTYARLDELLFGVCAAAIQSFVPRTWERLTSRPDWLLAAGLVLLLGAFWISKDRLGLIASAISYPLIALAYALIVIAAVSPRSGLHRVHLRITASVAGVSYSLYLIHKIIVHVTQLLLSREHVNIDSTPVFLACIATSLTAAWALHICIERPFMRLRSAILSCLRPSLGQLKTVIPVA